MGERRDGRTWWQFDTWLAYHGLSAALWPTPEEPTGHLDYQRLQATPPRLRPGPRPALDREAEAALLARLLGT
jgi:hypothetical protein